MENKETVDGKPPIVIEPMGLDALFEELFSCAKELDTMSLRFADHPKLRNLMKDHFPNFSATPEKEMPDKAEWRRIFFRGILVISAKQHGQLPEDEWKKHSLLLTFWNNHSVSAVPAYENNGDFFNFEEWQAKTYTKFLKFLQQYLKEQGCYKQKIYI